MPKICRQPFTAIEIDHLGDVYTCCPQFINFNKIGNIWENSIDEIWYSKFAYNIRKKVYNNDYSLCNISLCRQFKLKEFTTLSIEQPPLPKYVTLAYDKECNLCCVTCRDEKYKNTLEDIEKFNKKIDEVLVPLLKEAEILSLSGAGEALYSKHSRLLLKKLSLANKNILFNINTNGLLFNRENCLQVGILGRINEIFVSLPALDENIYNSIMIGSDINTVIKNIKWMSEEQHNTTNIRTVTINSVISKINYREIPKLVQFAKDLDIKITLSAFCDWGTKFGKNYKELAVWEEGNKEQKEFIDVLRNKTIAYENCTMTPVFKNLI